MPEPAVPATIFVILIQDSVCLAQEVKFQIEKEQFVRHLRNAPAQMSNRDVTTIRSVAMGSVAFAPAVRFQTARERDARLVQAIRFQIRIAQLVSPAHEIKFPIAGTQPA